MIFFVEGEQQKYAIKHLFTTNKFPPPFKEEFIKQADKRLLITWRTKFRGKILGI